MHITGVTSDIPVRDLAESLPFYATVLGRDPDLTPDDRTLEWILHREPEIAVRLTTPIDSPQVTAPVRLGLGVANLDAERVASAPDMIRTSHPAALPHMPHSGRAQWLGVPHAAEKNASAGGLASPVRSRS